METPLSEIFVSADLVPNLEYRGPHFAFGNSVTLGVVLSLKELYQVNHGKYLA